MDYYTEIKEKILQSEVYDRIKDYSKSVNKVKVYFEIGKILSNIGKEYGKNIIEQYSEKLMLEVGKKYNIRTLYRMRKFYEVFSNEKLTPLVSKLSWSHYILLISIKDINEIIYYINISLKDNLNKRELKERIDSFEYKRLSDVAKLKMISLEKLDIIDYVPNPITIKNNLYNDQITEYALKQLIISNLDSFLKQLGKGFSYIGNEYKIRLGDRYNYIDLLLFNIEYNCYVVVELKVTELKKEHLGQIQVYMNYIDNNLRKVYQDKTIGIIICKKDNKFIMEYCSDRRIISKEYKLV